MATVYVNGEFYPGDEASISVYDHGLLYGDGLFEGISIYHGRIFKLKEHLVRLFEGAKALMLKVPLSMDELSNVVEETARREGLSRGYIRLVLTRGKGDLGLDPANCPEPSLIIIADKIRLYPEELYQKGIPLVCVPTRRIGPEQWDPRIKSLNYLNNILAKMEARQAGCLEAVMMNQQGWITECTGDNIFLVKDGILLTPAAHLGILRGITRDTILDLAGKLGIPSEEGTYTRFDLYTADEIFMTGSGAEMIPVIELDGRIIGQGKPGPYYEKLRKAFLAEV